MSIVFNLKQIEINSTRYSSKLTGWVIVEKEIEKLISVKVN